MAVVRRKRVVVEMEIDADLKSDLLRVAKKRGVFPWTILEGMLRREIAADVVDLDQLAAGGAFSLRERHHRFFPHLERNA
jgi:hypothetical protein